VFSVFGLLPLIIGQRVRRARHLDLRPPTAAAAFTVPFAPAPAQPLAPLASPRYVMRCSKGQMTFDENIEFKYHMNMEQKPGISSIGAAKYEADPAYVNLKVTHQVFEVTHFRMKRVTQLQKVPSSFAHS
jgi:hypothetical protein